MDTCVEVLQDAIDERVRKTRELVRRFNETLTLDETPFSERYRSGKQNIAIRFIKPGGGDYGVILKPAPADQLESAFPLDVSIVEGGKLKIIPSIPIPQRFLDTPIGVGKPLYRFTASVFPNAERISRVTNGELHIFWVYVAVAEMDNCCVPDAVHELLPHLTISVIDNEARSELPLGLTPCFDRIELGYGPVNTCLSGI